MIYCAWNKGYLKFLLFIFIIGGIVILPSSKHCYAETITVEFDGDSGDYKWTLEDTEKTSEITWSTVGYTVKSTECLPGGYPQTGKYGVFYLDDSWKRSVTRGGIVTTTFTVPAEVIDEQADAAGVDTESLQQSGGCLYLNGIFQVWHNGVKYGSVKTNLSAIMNAETWKNKYDFKDHFDIKVPYNSQPQTAQITYAEYNKGSWDTVYKVDTSSSQWTEERDTDLSFESGSGLGFSTSVYPVYSTNDADKLSTNGVSIPAKISAVIDGTTKYN